MARQTVGQRRQSLGPHPAVRLLFGLALVLAAVGAVVHVVLVLAVVVALFAVRLWARDVGRVLRRRGRRFDRDWL